MPDYVKQIIREQSHPLSEGEIQEICESFRVTESQVYNFLEDEGLLP